MPKRVGIIADLETQGKLLSRREIAHTVNVHERCGTEIEFLVVPFITEELYQAHFSQREGAKSMHIACWPIAKSSWLDTAAEAQGDLAIAVIEAVRKEKSLKKLSLAAPVKELYICAESKQRAMLLPLLSAIRDVTNNEQIKFCKDSQATSVAEGVAVAIRL